MVLGTIRKEKITPTSDAVVAIKKIPPNPTISITEGKAYNTIDFFDCYSDQTHRNVTYTLTWRKTVRAFVV